MQPIAFSRPFMGEEEAQAAAAAIRSGWIVGGPRLVELEQRFAAICGVAHAVGVSSWTTGAFLVLKAWGIGPGDEVIVPSLTFIATVNVVAHCGATPVFADIDPLTWNIDPADIEHRITPRTKAIMPVDQLGLPCDMDSVQAIARRHGLKVLDDAACAFASRSRWQPVGSMGVTAVFSLHARKIVSTGEGGIITTDDDAFAERLRRLRHQGMSLSDYARHNASPTTFEEYPEIGFNYRITDVQAAIGCAQLDRLDEILMRRKAVAERYTEALANHPLLAAPHVPADAQPNWQSYQVLLRKGGAAERNVLMERLHARGIPTRRAVMASHREAPYRAMGARLPHTEDIAGRGLQLPMHPGLGDDQLNHVIDSLQRLAP